jgi:hypothetical protein
MLTARIMTEDNAPPRCSGLETSFDPNKRGPEETTGGVMGLIFGASPFGSGQKLGVMTRAQFQNIINSSKYSTRRYHNNTRPTY